VDARLWTMFPAESFNDCPLYVERCAGRNRPLCPLSFLRSPRLFFHQSPGGAPAVVHALPWPQRHAVVPALPELRRPVLRSESVRRLFGVVARCRSQDVPCRPHRAVERITRIGYTPTYTGRARAGRYKVWFKALCRIRSIYSFITRQSS